jgi:hypothetical protein
MDESELWQEIYAAFEFHRKKGEPDAQSALNRIVRRCLRFKVRPLITPVAFVAFRTVLAPEAVYQLKLAHGEASPFLPGGEIIVLSCMHGRFVVDGNNRVNRWRLNGSREPLAAIVLEARISGFLEDPVAAARHHWGPEQRIGTAGIAH